jgi:hypothetical protein
LNEVRSVLNEVFIRSVRLLTDHLD